jgi:acetoin utilization protein AcuB
MFLNLPSSMKLDTTHVSDLMTPAPHTIGVDQKLAKAHRIMRDHGVRHLPVLRAGKLVGVLTQRDLYFVESIAGVDVDIDKVADAMTADVYVVAPNATVREVARVMAERRFGCAVVMENEHVRGIFTVTDALRHIADAL